MTTGTLSLIHVIPGSVMHVVLNMPNSLQPRPLLFVLTALIDILYLLFLKNLETGSDRIVLDSIYCLLLLETPFPFSPINLLLINSKRKIFLIPTIYSKIFLFVMNLAWLPLYILLQDLKWNPHIHCLISELIYSFKKIKSKHFIISILLSLEKLFSLNWFALFKKLVD